MERRGYHWVRTEKSGGDAYSYWRENENGQCVVVRTSNGRYASIVYSSDFDCRGEASDHRASTQPSSGSSTHRVTCESSDNRREFCRTNTSGGVRLADRLSKSGCEQGRDWGWDRDGIWVDNGCRAVFEVGGGDSAGHDYQGSSSSTHRVTCESSDNRREFCRTDTSGGVRLVDRLSKSGCEQGPDWGWDRDGIWVDNGCRAVFEVGGGHSGSHGYHGSSSSTHRVTCESSDNRREYCRTNTSGGVRLVDRLSKSSCELGRDWDWDRDGIWVDNGCRAVFEVGGGR
jgi:hypothetical protein